jgi:hypothetical protein
MLQGIVKNQLNRCSIDIRGAALFASPKPKRPLVRRRVQPSDELSIAGACISRLELADVLLGIKLDPDLPDELELGLKEVDVPLLVGCEPLEQVLCHTVIDRVTILSRFQVERPRLVLGREIALDHLLNALPGPQWVQVLRVGKAF